MKSLLTLGAVSIAVLLLISMPVASQGPEKGAPGQQPKGAPPGGAPPEKGGPEKGGAPAQGAEKTFSGELTKVDTAKKAIMVKGTGGQPEMTFTYDDKTQVTGDEKSVQGLAGKSGANLKVSYREQGPDRIATRIEVSDKGGAAPGAPKGGPPPGGGAPKGDAPKGGPDAPKGAPK